MRLAVVRWTEATAPDEQTIGRRLADEGFDAFLWSDTPDSAYPPHHHPDDESLWVICGRITFGIEGCEHPLGPGDRLMLPRGTIHTAKVGLEGATYWVGRR